MARLVNDRIKLVMSAPVVLVGGMTKALAQEQEPNTLFIASDDTGSGDLSSFGGGEARGAPTPGVDLLADAGSTLRKAVRKIMKSNLRHSPRKLLSEVYTGSITITQYQRFQHVREFPQKGGVNLLLSTGN